MPDLEPLEGQLRGWSGRTSPGYRAEVAKAVPWGSVEKQADEIFSDGFETGGLGEWSTFVPEPGCSTILVMPTAVAE